MLTQTMIITFYVWVIVHCAVLPSSIYVSAAAGGKDKDVNNNDMENNSIDGMTNIPTTAPITWIPITSSPTTGDNSPVVVMSPVTSPSSTTNSVNDGGTTEDLNEDDETFDSNNNIKEACRTISRGMTMMTNTSMEIQIQYEILSTTSTPLYSGIAINTAMTNYLIDQYIKPYCLSSTNNNRRFVSVRQQQQVQTPPHYSTPHAVFSHHHLRALQNSNTTTATTTFFDSGDILGISRGETIILAESSCPVPSQDIGKVACHRLQSSSIIYVRDDYIDTNNNDDETTTKIERVERQIFNDISSSFTTGILYDHVIEGGETGVTQINYISGGFHDVSLQGDPYSYNSQTFNSKNGTANAGLTPAGKAFLTLFILCFISVIAFFGYKYGYPKYQKQYHSKQRNDRTTISEIPSTRHERWNPFTVWYDRYQRSCVPSEIVRPYNFVMSDSELEQQQVQQKLKDRNVIISETMETNSTMDGFGTEMILDDLYEEEERLSPSYKSPSNIDRYTPQTLPRTKEFGRFIRDDIGQQQPKQQEQNISNFEGFSFTHSQNSFHNDAFSFSDVNIIIDDSSSYASTSPQYVQATKRTYTIPDTVNL